MNNQVQIGILGLGSRSTCYYITLLNQYYNEIKGGYSTCPFILYNSDFDKINPYLPNQFESLKQELSKSIERIKSLNIGTLLIPNITLHETFDKLNSNIPITHPVKLAIEAIINSGQKNVYLFGSKYTMESEYISVSLKKSGINILNLDNDTVAFIDNFRQSVYKGIESPNDTKKFIVLQKQLSKTAPVVMACTELSVFAEEETIDMVRLQVKTALAKIM